LATEFNRFARRPLIRVRPQTDGSWRAEADDMIRDGQGQSADAALGDWLKKNSDRLGFDVRIE
jgi:hypothetical protein